MIQYIALLRGINVGKSRRIAMADLRSMVERLGYSDVCTLLNTGNVVFTAKGQNQKTITSAMESEIEATFGFSVSVIVLTAAQLTMVIEENPLRAIADDPSKHLVAFAPPSILERSRMLVSESWTPESYAIGENAAYLWCAQGITHSNLMRAFTRKIGDASTTRNWATVLKLNEVAANE